MITMSKAYLQSEREERARRKRILAVACAFMKRYADGRNTVNDIYDAICKLEGLNKRELLDTYWMYTDNVKPHGRKVK